MVWRADLFYLRDGGAVDRGGEGAVRGDRALLQLMVGMGMVGVLAVMGDEGAGGGAAHRGAATAGLQVTTAALLPLPVLQQRHLRQQRKRGAIYHLPFKDTHTHTHSHDPPHVIHTDDRLPAALNHAIHQNGTAPA